MNDLFIIASRKRFRFPTVVGSLTVEDLWNLPLRSVSSSSPSLDSVAVSISNQIKQLGEESFVSDEENPARAELELKLEIVKFVISIIKEEAIKKEQSAAIASRNNRIDEIISRKKDKELESMSIEELEKLKVA